MCRSSPENSFGERTSMSGACTTAFPCLLGTLQPAEVRVITVTFQVPAKLRPGINVITVVARENDDTVSRYTRIIRRDGPNGEALTAPKGEELGEDWEFGGGEE